MANTEELKNAAIDFLKDWFSEVADEGKATLEVYANEIAPQMVEQATKAVQGDPIAKQNIEHLKQHAKNKAAIFAQHQATKAAELVDTAIDAVISFLISFLRKAI